MGAGGRERLGQPGLPPARAQVGEDAQVAPSPQELPYPEHSGLLGGSLPS